MNRLKPAAAVVALAVVAIAVVASGLIGQAYAADEKKSAEKMEDKSAGTVAITSPADGAKLPGPGAKIAFDVSGAPKAEHVHIYVDGEEVGRLHELKGSYPVDKLSVGKHWLCVRVVDKGHTPIGAEKCVSVTVGNIPPMGY
jgi:hypothetical protein